MSRFLAGWIAASVVGLAAIVIQPQTAQAQWAYPDDAVVIRRGPYGALPPGPVRGGYLDDEAYDDAVPSREVVKMVRSLGFKPLGPAVRQRGVYTVSAVNQQGNKGRVVVDAYSGRLMRFVAATDGATESGGQPGVATPSQPQKSAPPVPRVASRTPANQAPTSAPVQPAQTPSATATAAPETTAPVTAPPAQAKTADAKSADAKSADAKPADVRSVPGPAQAKPSVQLLPTQEMPPVQGLD